MKTSDTGVKFVASQEGCVLHVYKDWTGQATVGVGHLVRPGEVFPPTITQEEALDLLRKDLAIAENQVARLVKVPLSQGQFDALVDFVFNLGGGALQQSGLLRLLNQGKYAAAAEEFTKWSKARVNGVLKTSPVLLHRRELERQMFLASTSDAQVPTVTPSVDTQPNPPRGPESDTSGTPGDTGQPVVVQPPPPNPAPDAPTQIVPGVDTAQLVKWVIAGLSLGIGYVIHLIHGLVHVK